MPPTTAAPEHRLHRFAAQPGLISLIETSRWCRCGEQHPVLKQAYLCLKPGCGFLLTVPLGG